MSAHSSSSVSWLLHFFFRAKSYPADERNQWLQSGTPKGKKLNGNFLLFQVKHFSNSIHRLYGNFRRLTMMLLKIKKTRNHWLWAQAFSSKTETRRWLSEISEEIRPEGALCSRSSRARHEKLLWCCLRDRIFQSWDGNIHRPSDDDDIEAPRARPAAKWKWKITLVETSSSIRAVRGFTARDTQAGKMKKSQNKLWLK